MAEGWDCAYSRDASSRRGSDEDDRDLGSDDIYSPDHVSSLLSPDKDPLNSNRYESSQLFPSSSLSNLIQDEPLQQYNEERNHTTGPASWNTPRETLDACCYREPQRGLPPVTGSNHSFSTEAQENTITTSKVLENLLLRGYKLHQAQAPMGGAIAKNPRDRAAFQLSLLKGGNRETLDDTLELNATRGVGNSSEVKGQGIRDLFPETFNEVKLFESNKDGNSSSRRTSVSIGDSEGLWNTWNEPAAVAPSPLSDVNNFASGNVAIGCNPSSLYGNGLGLNNSNLITNGFSHSGNLPNPGTMSLLEEDFSRKLNVISPQHPGPGPVDTVGAMPRCVTNNGFHGENVVSHTPHPLSLTPQYNNTISFGSLPGCVTPGHVTPNINMRGSELSGNHRLSNNINGPTTPQYKGLAYTSSHHMNMSRGPVKQLDFGADEGPFLPGPTGLSTSPFGDPCVSNFPIAPIARNHEIHISDSMYMPAHDLCMTCRQMADELCTICRKRFCGNCIYHHQCLAPQLNFNRELCGQLPRMPLPMNSLASRHNNGNYPLQNSPNHLAVATKQRPMTFMETFAPPTPQNGRNVLVSPLKHCDFHPQYFVRFATMNNTESVCTVCLLKRIGGKFAKRYNKVIPIPNFDNVQYQELSNELFVIVEKLPILISRYFRESVDPFEFDATYRHLVFKTYEDVDMKLYPLVNNLNKLIEHVNTMIRFFSNFTINMLKDYTSNALFAIREDYDKLWKHVEGNGPSKIALAAGTEDCGKGEHSFLAGPAMSGKIVKDRDTVCYVVIRNRYDQPRESNRDALKFDIRSEPGGVPVRFTMNSAALKGVYEVFFTLPQEGNYKITATVNNEMIRGSPHVTLVTSDQINYNRFYEPKVLIGHGFLGDNVTDSEAGFFNRPWGVHVTHDGFILLADRSNHKVHVIDQQYSYSHSIGGNGTTDGKFSRPSKAIEVRNSDGTRDVLVSDKDNNRLQILTWNGDFKRKTSETEDLKYPWDVCLTQEGIILCTDSRKQRISCFNLNFQLVKVVSLPSGVSPRGICMGYLNHCIVTEFCNHDILILYAPSQKFVLNDPNQTCYRRYSMKTTQKPTHNSYQGHFDKRCGEKNQDRLQGVTMDQFGNILVCDSRQRKVRVVSYLGRPVAEWEIEGEPQGLAAVPDKVAVVNAGRNTLDLFF